MLINLINLYLFIYILNITTLYFFFFSKFINSKNISLQNILGFINKYHKNVNIINLCFLSFFGLPPFFLFFIKFNIIILLFYSTNFFLIFFIFLLFFINIIFYLQLFFFNNFSYKVSIYYLKNSNDYNVLLLLIFLNFFNIFGVFFFIDFFFIYEHNKLKLIIFFVLLKFLLCCNISIHFMSTTNQSYNSAYKRPKTNRRPKLKKSPQRRGVTLRLRIVTPRKPNSARRPITKLRLSSRRWALSHIPGSYGTYGHNLRRFSKVLVNGRGARDLPTVNYTNIRGKFDFNPVWGRKHRRSVYGVKQDPSLRTHVRRELRKFLYELNKNNKDKINKYYKLG